MTTRQTPDAVREALQRFADYADPRGKIPATMPITAGSPMAKRQLTMGDCYAARDALAALDSRAGDAGEGDRYTQGYAQGQADAAQLHQWMQDKAWQDTVLMLVHYQMLAERTWLVGHEEAAAKLTEWWRHARALSETKSVEDIAATPAPAVDAVPAGEVEPPLNRHDLYRFMDTLKLSEKREVAKAIRFVPAPLTGETDMQRWSRMLAWAAENGKKTELAIAIRAALLHGEGRK